MDGLTFLQDVRTRRGESLWTMSFEKPVMLVFLRHFGCVFCKEAMTELARLKDKIRSRNTTPVLVHLADPGTADKFFGQYGLADVDYVSDPEGSLYRQFGLVKGRMQQLMGLNVWLRTFQAGVIGGHGLSTQLIGDGFQMPGVFLIYQGEVKAKFVHHTIADRPDYLQIAACHECNPTAGA